MSRPLFVGGRRGQTDCKSPVKKGALFGAKNKPYCTKFFLQFVLFNPKFNLKIGQKKRLK